MTRPVVKSPPHAGRRVVWVLYALALAFVVVAALEIAGGYLAGAVVALAAAAAAALVGRSHGGHITAVQLTNTAVQHLTRGNLAETEAVLASLKPSDRRGIVARAAGTLRAMIALYEGRLEDSVRHATSALDVRVGLVSRSFESGQVAAAHAVRGLAHAALGDGANAKQDADAAENSAFASPEVIARARLVRAVVASRAAYHEEAFRTYLGANARLVLEHAMPRERALFRALRRMSRSPQRSVYREQGRAKDDQAPSKLASWIAYVAPEAASYVQGDRLLAESVVEEAIPSGVPSDVHALRTARARVQAGTGAARRRRLVLVLGAGLVALLTAAWVGLTPPAGAPALAARATAPAPVSAELPVVALLLFAASIAFIVLLAAAQRRQHTLAIARRMIALGDRERAKRTLEQLAGGRDAFSAASAGLELARIATSDADFAEAISRCDAAIARIDSPRLHASANELLLPALMTESAVAMAARGGLEDADAELAILGRDFPTYPRLASSLLRVQLVRAVRGGDRDAACAVARSRTAELPLPYREDVLADLVLASRGEVTDDELARLETEIDDDAELRHWLDAVAPGLRAARRAATGTSVRA